nr:hypothetical protein [Pseudopedobacter sp.]
MKRASFLHTIGVISLSPFIKRIEKPFNNSLILYIGAKEKSILNHIVGNIEKLVLIP